jgi:carboxymethylenebutenolidase
MSDFIEVKSGDRSFRAYCVLPEKTPAPVVVVLHEIFGINADMKETCRWLVSRGFIALRPDLFWRDAPGLSLSSWSEPEWKRGLELYQAYDRNVGVADVGLVVDAGRTERVVGQSRRHGLLPGRPVDLSHRGAQGR